MNVEKTVSAASHPMRFIRSGNPPRHKAKPLKAKPSLDTFLFIASIMLSITAMVLIAYTLSVVRDLEQSARRLEVISEMEARISTQLDSFNLGLQTISRRTHQQLSQLHSRINKVSSDYELSRDELQSLSANFEADILATNDKLYDELSDQLQSVIVTSIRRELKAHQTARGTTPISKRTTSIRSSSLTTKGYSRIVSPDGSVTYKKNR